MSALTRNSYTKTITHAMLDNGKIVHINDFKRHDSKGLTCPNCKAVIVYTAGVRSGTTSSPYFRHNGAACDIDEYKHAVDKLLIDQKEICYQNALNGVWDNIDDVLNAIVKHKPTITSECIQCGLERDVDLSQYSCRIVPNDAQESGIRQYMQSLCRNAQKRHRSCSSDSASSQSNSDDDEPELYTADMIVANKYVAGTVVAHQCALVFCHQENSSNFRVLESEHNDIYTVLIDPHNPLHSLGDNLSPCDKCMKLFSSIEDDEAIGRARITKDFETSAIECAKQFVNCFIDGKYAGSPIDRIWSVDRSYFFTEDDSEQIEPWLRQRFGKKYVLIQLIKHQLSVYYQLVHADKKQTAIAYEVVKHLDQIAALHAPFEDFLTCKLGKYKGVEYKKVPNGFLTWIINTPDVFDRMSVTQQFFVRNAQ